MPAALPASIYRRRRVLAGGGAAIVLVVGILVASRLTGPPEAESQGGVGSTTTTVTIPHRSSIAPVETTTTIPTGRFTSAGGSSAVAGTGTLYRYAVEVEVGTGIDADAFARAVDATLSDRRGWTTADGVSLQRVSDGTAQFTVRLATPATTDRLCAPLTTNGEASCGHNAMAVINLTRWLRGAVPSKLDLTDYRHYVITHEVGHLLGHGHEPCPGPGQRATTMMQQTYTIGNCTPNPWPAPDA